MTKKLIDLTPTEFENLTYDLLKNYGFSNLTWRTPGADGGRDIEGYANRILVSGDVITERWYIDCKRYSSSLDFPTVHAKICYADSNNADYLLIVTTNNFSPACINEVEKWNLSKKYPKILIWPGHELDWKVRLVPIIMAKYGLDDITINQTSQPFFDLAIICANLVRAAKCSNQILGNRSINNSLDIAEKISYLIASKMEQLKLEGKLSKITFSTLHDSLPHTSKLIKDFDRFGIEVVLAIICHAKGVLIDMDLIKYRIDDVDIYETYTDVMKKICTLCDIEIEECRNESLIVEIKTR